MSKDTSITLQGLSHQSVVIPFLRFSLQLRKISQHASNSNEGREQNE